MPVDPSPQPFVSDTRGNRLADWGTVDDSAGHHLWLRGSDEVQAQIAAAAPTYAVVPLPPEAARAWTHVLRGPGRLLPRTKALLDLLMAVITLPRPTNIRTGLALDWYKRPAVGVDPYSWPNSEAGDLVSRGKYLYRFDDAKQREVGRKLVGLVCDIVTRHALLQQVDIILDVPGHDASQVSFGSRMAFTVSKDLNIERARVRCRDEFRAQSKNLDPVQRADVISNHFYVEESIEGGTALVVDDVFRSGDSMNETARAALAAGASSVYGICAVRTMRR